ncbi:MAG TPA: tRNA (adenosine(37)-N6)-threonylcarbamoyltransferase complex ATPase subunit type 1 TsaE [Acidimicrobiia bacterium]|nr:tRNA (adenosine(37)-N6)-threonylcarbamoyltransferase complex ATPase subunit type 1 TsaE [Acidimicrobiia bacterium]
MILHCATEADTRSVGRRLAALMRSGDIVLLAGDLGAGKTVFAGGIGEGLGLDEPVVSPTFVIVRRYTGLVPMVHVDLYRVGSIAEIDDLDLDLEAVDGVLVVEWGHAAEQAFGDDHLVVKITPGPDGGRSIEFVPRGSWARRPLQELAP